MNKEGIFCEDVFRGAENQLIVFTVDVFTQRFPTLARLSDGPVATLLPQEVANVVPPNGVT